MSSNIVNSQIINLENLFLGSYSVDFYQREYVWKTKQIQDLITDLSNEFLSKYTKGDIPKSVGAYNEYFMGEIIICTKDNLNSIIDGQQRITSFMLLIIYILNTFKDVPGLPKSKLETLITKDVLGEIKFTLEVEERNACMQSLFYSGEYNAVDSNPSVNNIIGRYNDIKECWNPDINEDNIIVFTYWLLTNIVFSKVWTDKDTFAYVIFETMNDRGLSLSPLEMLRSYLLASVSESKRDVYLKKFDDTIDLLRTEKFWYKEDDFFKAYLRGLYANNFSKNQDSNYNKIGNAYHRFVRDKRLDLGLTSEDKFEDFIDRLVYYSTVHKKINEILINRQIKDFFYMVINSDFQISLQVPILLSCINYNDKDDTVYNKFKIISKLVTYWYVAKAWVRKHTGYSYLYYEAYSICKDIRGMNVDQLKEYVKSKLQNIELYDYLYLMKTNGKNVKVTLGLISNIIGRESEQFIDILSENDIEIEHIWANKYESFSKYCEDENNFEWTRDCIGGLLLLSKYENTSLGDHLPGYKIKRYICYDRILAKTLNEEFYKNNPGFKHFIDRSNLPFKSYTEITTDDIYDRAELYKEILYWDMKQEL